MIIKGKHTEIIVYNDYVEKSALTQLQTIADNRAFTDAKIRVMPDVHAGAGAVIGFTMPIHDKVCPNTVGVDIGCGLLGYRLPDMDLDFKELDKFIRNNIPSGRNIHNHFDEALVKSIYETMHKNLWEWDSWEWFKRVLKEVATKTGQDFDYVLRSLGTMGGGNHYIELGRAEDNNLWITVHSGSRNFGLRIAKWHQHIAEREANKTDFLQKMDDIKRTEQGKNIELAIKELHKQYAEQPRELAYLTGNSAQYYYYDMQIAQMYAELNRYIMIYKLVTFCGVAFDKSNTLQTVHNYINFDDKILRKGAVSAHEDELLLIPMNMAYGTLLCKGKGNAEYNYSAPHGAGRIMSRSKARASVGLQDFQDKMKEADVWSTCINESTIDESPQAYKNPEQIIKYLEPTVDIITRIKPLYNFKANS